MPVVVGSRSGKTMGAGIRVSGYKTVRHTPGALCETRYFPSKCRVVLEGDDLSEAF